MGRPRGWALNRRAFEHQLVARRTTKTEIAVVAGVSLQMLGDLAGGKRRTGASPRVATALAEAMECPVEMLFPEAAGFRAPDFSIAEAVA